MRATRRRDTAPEIAVRSRLHAMGLRYRVDWPVPGQRRRTIDIAFTRAKVAVYIDGCFWHGCPIHATKPRMNAAWWDAKLTANQARDSAVNEQLIELGWLVMRFWEHEEPAHVAAEIHSSVTRALKQLPPRARQVRQRTPARP